MAVKLNTQDRIIIAGDACTRDLIGQLRTMSETASHATKSLLKIDAADVWEIDKRDVLERAQHNAQALTTLLSMAADAALYMNRGLCDILRAIDDKEKEKAQRIIENAKRDKEREEKHKEYMRAKKKKQEALEKTL